MNETKKEQKKGKKMLKTNIVFVLHLLNSLVCIVWIVHWGGSGWIILPLLLWLGIFVLLEYIAGIMKKKKKSNLNDGKNRRQLNVEKS